MNKDKIDAKILAVAGKGGVGKTSLAAVMVKLLVAAYPDKRILAIDADPAVGLSTALGVDVKLTVDDIRKEVVANAEDGNAKAAIELLGEARYRIFDALVEMDGFSFYCDRKTGGSRLLLQDQQLSERSDRSFGREL